MPLELPEVIQLGGYILPKLSNLFTSLLQKQALQILPELTLIACKFLTEEKYHIRRIMTTFNNRRSTYQNLLVDSRHTISNSEQTTQRYSAYYVLPTLRPLVTKPNGINYPNNLCNGFFSKWHGDFSGYLACGSTTHRFDSYSKKNKIDDKHYFDRFCLGKRRATLSFMHLLLVNQMLKSIRPKLHQHQQALYLIVKISISTHIVMLFFPA